MPLHFTTPLLRKSENKSVPLFGLPFLSIPSSCWPLYEKTGFFRFETYFSICCLCSLCPRIHNAPLPPFNVTWLHLMTGLTPAYRIKLISTKQGLVEEREGVEKRKRWG